MLKWKIYCPKKRFAKLLFFNELLEFPVNQEDGF